MISHVLRPELAELLEKSPEGGYDTTKPLRWSSDRLGNGPVDEKRRHRVSDLTCSAKLLVGVDSRSLGKCVPHRRSARSVEGGGSTHHEVHDVNGANPPERVAPIDEYDPVTASRHISRPQVSVNHRGRDSLQDRCDVSRCTRRNDEVSFGHSEELAVGGRPLAAQGPSAAAQGGIEQLSRHATRKKTAELGLLHAPALDHPDSPCDFYRETRKARRDRILRRLQEGTSAHAWRATRQC